MDFNRRLGNALQDMRREKRISQTKMGESLGLSQTGISQMESGQVSISAYIVHHYLKTCGGNPEALFNLLEGKKEK